MKKFILIFVTLIITISSTACFPFSALQGSSNTTPRSHTSIDGTNSTNQNNTNLPEDIFTGNSFTVGDGSVIYFYDDGTYMWYENPNIIDDNYYSGDYRIYGGYNAIDYIATDISEYGITKTEMFDIFSGDIGNFYCLILNKTTSSIDRIYSAETIFTPHMGVYYEEDRDFYSLNLNTAGYTDFILNPTAN